MRFFIIYFLLIVGLSACNTYETVLKNKDVTYKLQKANEYYEKGDYYAAAKVYENIMPSFRGNNNYESIYYRYAYSFYYDKDYLNAAYQFKNFTEFFSKNNSREEMEYMYALSLFKDSKKTSLEQTQTQKSIAAFQNFIAGNPNSKYVDSSIYFMDLAIEKLETKEADAAKLYYNLDQYKSASVAYKTLIFDYPTSQNLDYYYYMVVNSLYKYADNSFDNLKRERFLDMVQYHENLKTYFPQSSYLSKSEQLYTLAQNKINKLKNDTK